MKKVVLLAVIASLLLTACQSSQPPVEKKRIERIPNEMPDVIKTENQFAEVAVYDKFGQWPYKGGDEYYSSEIGTWFTVWWTKKGEATYSHWYDKTWTRLKPVDYGYYSSGDSDYLISVLSRLKYIGIDYVVLDDTNGHWNDMGLIARNMNAVFQTAFELGEFSPKVAIATGAPIREGNAKQQTKELDAYWEYYEQYPGTFYTYKDKPLLLMYIAGEVNQRHYDDRFTIRHGTGFISWQNRASDQTIFKTEGNWGWVFDIQNAGSEVFGVQPGYNKSHQGTKIDSIFRNNGQHYIEAWLAAIKANPAVIIIPSYNDHAEETGWEATVPVRENTVPNSDPGTPGEDPYLYEKITEAYLALKYGYIDGFIYREESSSNAFLFKDNQLTQVTPGETDLVIIIPDGYMAWEKAKNEV